jgi:hypothetical protein
MPILQRRSRVSDRPAIRSSRNETLDRVNVIRRQLERLLVLADHNFGIDPVVATAEDLADLMLISGELDSIIARIDSRRDL